MPFLNSVLSWLTTKRLQEIKLYSTYGPEIQRETLFKLLNYSKGTEIGKKYSFESIVNEKEYAAAVPLSDYNMLKPTIDRIRCGEQNLLWPTAIKWFAKSSGTTQDKSKFIPVSKESLEDCHFRGGKDVVVIYTNNYPDNSLLFGKTLVLGGSHQISNMNSDSFFGDLSAILIQNMPFWAQFYSLPDQSIALMDEWEQKIELMAKTTIQENVKQITGVPSWTLVLLNKVLELTKAKNIHEVWPGLELFVHGGVSFKPYKEQFKKLLPSANMRYLETYNASEGFFAIQDDPETDDMLLMLDLGIFYEFIPFEEIEKQHPETLILSEVELNKNYAIVITTNSGLWRYLIGDTVLFTSRNPYKIKITGRVKQYINVFGEELIVDNAENALQVATTRTNSNIREYTVAPLYMGDKKQGAHQWIIEFINPPTDLIHFMEILDNELKSLNSDYEAKRYKNMALDFPNLIHAKEGTFYNWLKSNGKLGGQHKVPRLSNDRTYADSIIKFLNG
ncbi:MAG: GH3 auxin-responsive promoter family protein [Bacteroidales bacterium]|nr:GH3 auxin-responsive promoter family protein [Bacteroidales bacterium]